MLRPAAESLALTEASLEKARGKLQGLQDVRDRLQAEQVQREGGRGSMCWC